MTTPSKNNHKPRAARGIDKRTLKARQDRSELIKSTGAQSPLWVGEVKLTGEALIQAGIDLGMGEKLAQSLRIQADSAEKELLSLQIIWDERYGIFAGTAEIAAVKPEDLTNLALPLLEEQSYKLAPPVLVTVKYDLITAEIRIHVRTPPGSFACRIEISPNPMTPTSFVALKGKGTRRALSGYASGGWWVQALMYDNENESDYSPPVFVMVP
jgi:hypothetical protein